MSVKRRLSLHFVLALVSEAMNKIFPLLILKISTTRMGLASFGFAQYGIGVIEMLVPFVVWGYNSFGTIMVGKQAGDHEQQIATVSNVVCLKFCHAIICCLLLNLVVAFTPSLEKYRLLFGCLGFVLFFSAAELLWVNVASQKLAIVTPFIFLSRLLSFVTIYAFVHGPDDAVLLAVLTMLSNVMIGLLTTIWGRHWFCWRAIRWQRLKEIFLFSQRFALVVIIYAIMDRMDLVMAERLFGEVGAGLYSGPLRIVNSLIQIISAILLPLFAEFVILKDRAAITRQTNVALEVLALLILPMVIGMAFVAKEVISLILGPEFQGASSILILQTCGLIPFTLMQLFGNQILLTFGQSKNFNLILIIGALVAVVCLWVFGKTWGVNGVAVGSLVGKALMAFFTVLTARKVIDRVGWAPFAKPLIAVTLMTGGLWIWRQQTLFWLIPIGGAIYALSCALLYRHFLGQVWRRLMARWAA